MERELPPWQPFDPESPGDSPLTFPELEHGSRIVAVLATPGVDEDGWGPRVATRLAREWTSRSERVLLADLNLAEPSLHDVLGVPNGEGVSDVVLWGASFQRVAHVVGPGLLFASAGTVVADPTPVLNSSRWGAITDGFQRADATLIAYLPIGTAGGHDLLDRASDVVVLARQDETGQLELGAMTNRVRAVLGPESDPTDTLPVERLAPEPEPVPVAAEPTFPPEPTFPSAEPPWQGEVTASVSAVESSRSRGRLWLLALLLITTTVVVLVAWSGIVNVPFLTPFLAGSDEVDGDIPVSVAPVEAEPPPAVEPLTPTPPDPALDVEPTGPVQAFSLTLAAYESLGAARQEISGLEPRRPDLLMVVAPIVDRNGTPYYRLLIGPALDRDQALALRGSLQEALGVAAAHADTWIVRDTHLAFHLGDEASLEAARARAAELETPEIFPYVLRLSAGDVPVYRIYAGAYISPGEASYLRDQLEAAGLGDSPLISRQGTRPQ